MTKSLLISPRWCVLLFISVLLAPGASARVGATEAELTAQFGEPTARAVENVMVKGKLLPSFPKLTYEHGEWRKIVGVFVDNTCAKSTYDKEGLWPEEDYARVLADNAQGATWAEDPGTSKLRDVSRKWIRSDGATGYWRKNLGLTIVTPAFVAAEAAVKDKARNHIKVLPKE